ncbi:hypothetical protein BGZ79_008707 [Entomortierella chlamydospora]|nr:hypothetical protein BGZ79_008707 [Entomortierella chlamydospora]
MVREHCVRVRRMMGRKHQLHRREQFSTTASDMYHKASNQHMDSSCAMSSSRSPSHHSTGTTSHQRRQRNSFAADRRSFFSDRFSESGYDGDICSLMPTSTITSSASPFFLGCSSNYRREAHESHLMLPLPPVVQRIDLAGSPFSPFSPSNPYDSMECSVLVDQQRIIRPGNLRTHSSGGGGSGGGGDGGATAPDGMNPGGGDATDGDQPSEYTFRRRNAIVEGSEDAPKADDFPNSSPK